PRANVIAIDDLISGPITSNISDLTNVRSNLITATSAAVSTSIRQTPSYRLDKNYEYILDVSGYTKKVLTDVTLEMRDMYTGTWTVV
ncbi:MAG: hypothetical protein EBR67_09135, partial [Proteobacteria bacterium]|nr:hypothetical protein [Pseudomonadota bacterium]